MKDDLHKRRHAKMQPVRRRGAKQQGTEAATAADVPCRELGKSRTTATAASAETQAAATAATPYPQADACFAAMMGPMVLSVGSDCSGWCTELQAARAVCPFPVRQFLACDSEAYVRRLIQHCIKPTCLFDDLRTRRFDQTQRLDIYCCGWPCQAFSRSGLRQGMEDRRGRGALIMNVMAVIEATLPVSFILENVPALVSDFSDVFEAIISTLQSMAGSKYEVHWDLRNTRIHGGLPQDRTRIYVVGILKSKLKNQFRWPPPVACVPLASLLSDGDPSIDRFTPLCKGMQQRLVAMIDKMPSSGKDTFERDFIIDIRASIPFVTEDYVPTLTATRCSQLGYWSTKRFRRLSIPEMMRLQGADFPLLHGWEEVISERQMGEIVGNDVGLVLWRLPLVCFCHFFSVLLFSSRAVFFWRVWGLDWA